jgi:DNA-binding XRE family transcriptional regulator
MSIVPAIAGWQAWIEEPDPEPPPPPPEPRIVSAFPRAARRVVWRQVRPPRSTLIEARRRAGLTQNALAKKIGCHRAVICTVEGGSRNASLTLMATWMQALPDLRVADFDLPSNVIELLERFGARRRSRLKRSGPPMTTTAMTSRSRHSKRKDKQIPPSVCARHSTAERAAK